MDRHQQKPEAENADEFQSLESKLVVFGFSRLVQFDLVACFLFTTAAMTISNQFF